MKIVLVNCFWHILTLCYFLGYRIAAECAQNALSKKAKDNKQDPGSNQFMIISVEVEQGIGLFSLTFVLCKMRIVYASTEIFLVCDGQSFFKFWRTVGIG